MNEFIVKIFEKPDEVYTFPKTKLEIVHLDDFTISRMVFGF